MRRFPPVLALVMILGAASAVKADDAVSLERFRLLQTNGIRVEGTNGVLTADKLEGMSVDGAPLSVLRKDIRVLDRYSGTKAGKYTLVGAGVGFGTALLGYLLAEAEASSDPYKDINHDMIAPLIIGTTAVGGLIGLAAGASSKKWERVPLNPVLGLDLESRQVSLAIRISL